MIKVFCGRCGQNCTTEFRLVEVTRINADATDVASLRSCDEQIEDNWELCGNCVNELRSFVSAEPKRNPGMR